MNTTPETLVVEGHWDTEGGAEMAREYVTRSRADLMHGELSDFALANRQYLAGRNDLDLLAWQTAAKERIRWLSAQLATLSSKGRGEGSDTCAEMRALCEHCGGTGDVHRADGEWLGSCDCRGEAPEPCSPVAREGESLLASVVAEIEAEIPMPGNDRQMRGTYAQGVFAALQIARQALAQTPPALSGGGELREALDPDDVRGILLRSAEQADVATRLHRGAVADGLTDDTSVAEWCEKQARAFRLAALAQSTPAVGEGWRDIATAPKDGTRLWLFYPHAAPDDQQVVGWWSEEFPNEARWMDHADCREDEPTKWLPLPVVPHGGGL